MPAARRPGARGRRATSKSASQTHETSRPSAVRSLRIAEQVELAALERQRPQHLVGARRVLDQQQDRSVAPARRRRSPRGRTRARPSRRPATMSSSGTSSASAQRRGGERVVDVVEAGEGEGDPLAARGRAQRERGGADALRARRPRRPPRAPGARSRRSGSGSGRGGRAAPRRRRRARRSGGSAWSPRRAAARAARATCRRRRRTSDLVRRQVRDERVVGVEHEPAGVARGDLGPAVGDRLELAVAVELVAEEVGEQQHARVQLADDLRQPELVDLEQPEVGRLAVVEQRAGHAAGHVRPGAVVDQPRGRCVRGSPRPSPRSSSCRSSPR